MNSLRKTDKTGGERVVAICTLISNIVYTRMRFSFLGIKALVNEDTLLRTHCCPWCFLGCANWETFVADTKCFWTKSETFFASRTQNLCPQQMLRAGKRPGSICDGNNVSATMSPRLPGPWEQDSLWHKIRHKKTIAGKCKYFANQCWGSRQICPL